MGTGEFLEASEPRVVVEASARPAPRCACRGLALARPAPLLLLLLLHHLRPHANLNTAQSSARSYTLASFFCSVLFEVQWVSEMRFSVSGIAAGASYAASVRLLAVHTVCTRAKQCSERSLG